MADNVLMQNLADLRRRDNLTHSHPRRDRRAFHSRAICVSIRFPQDNCVGRLSQPIIAGSFTPLRPSARPAGMESPPDHQTDRIYRARHQ